MNKNKQQFKVLMDNLGLSSEEIAEALGLTIESYKNMIQPSTKTPKWVKSVLLVEEARKNKCQECKSGIMVNLGNVQTSTYGKSIVYECNNNECQAREYI